MLSLLSEKPMDQLQPWTALNKRLPVQASKDVLDRMKTEKRHKISDSNLVGCTMCVTGDPHNMRYRILRCVSPACIAGTDQGRACGWKCKVLTCKDNDVVNIFEKGEHLSRYLDAPSGKLTEKDKAVARSLTKLFVKPVRIPEMNNGVAPALDKIQNFVSYFRKTEMNDTDDIEELEKMIWSQSYKGTEPDAEPFAFSAKTRSDGSLQIGKGTDGDDFFVGYTTKLLMKRLDRDPKSFIFTWTRLSNSVKWTTLRSCAVSPTSRERFISSRYLSLHSAKKLNTLQCLAP